MVVLQATLDAFHARSRRNNREAEAWGPLEIEIEVSKLPIKPPFWDVMRPDQQITVLIAIRDSRLGIFNEMGSGKTLVVYSLMHYYREVEGASRFLVGVPNRTNKDEWLGEAKKWCPDTYVMALPSSLEEKVAALERSTALAFIDTFSGITHLVCAKREKKKGRGHELILDPKVVMALAESLDGVVADESSFLGNHDSLQTRIFTHLAKPERMHFFNLSGTPFGKDPTPLQPQMKMIDGGYTLGETLGLFRAVFFRENKGYWSRFDYKFRREMLPVMNQYLAHASVRFSLAKNAGPKVITRKVMINLPNDAHEYYERARKALQMAAISHDVNRLKGAFNNLRAISSGFLPVKLANGERSIITFRENYKLDALMKEVRATRGEKFLVVHFFRHSGNVLAAAMAKAKVKVAQINGGTRDMSAERERFLNDPTCQGLLLSADAGAFGLNLQIAKFGYIYESPVPVIIRTQVLRRFIRPAGPHESVTLVDFVCRGTADERILSFHATGKDIYKAIMGGKVKI